MRLAKPDSEVHQILLRKIANDPLAANDRHFLSAVDDLLLLRKTSNYSDSQAPGHFYLTPDPLWLAQTFRDIINADLQKIRVTEYDS